MSNIFSFTPVPRTRNRHDGWTDQKQQDFIDALAACGVVRAAAETVGMSTVTAYALRNSEGAHSFAEAWDKALKTGRAQLEDLAMDRVLNGIAVPQFYKGEQVGERRWFDNRLLMFMLRQTNTRRFGPHAAQYDFVDERLAAEAASEKRRLDQLSEVNALITAIDKDMDEPDFDSTTWAAQSIQDTRDRLEALAEKLGAGDAYKAEMMRLDELAAGGRLTAKNVRFFKKQVEARYADR
jgi:hypothetical protein